jgi:prophage regulatory protein
MAAPPQYTKDNDGLIRLPEVLKLIPVCKSTWWKGIETGIYPKPVKIGVRSVAWRRRDILPLIEHGIRPGEPLKK